MSGEHHSHGKLVKVMEVAKGTPAEGKVGVGDQIIAINNIVPADHHHATQLLKSLTGKVCVVVATGSTGESFKEVELQKHSQATRVGVTCASEPCTWVEVANVKPGGGAAGIVHEGDVLLFVNNTATSGDATAALLLLTSASGQFTVHVQRENKLIECSLRKATYEEDSEAGITCAQTGGASPVSPLSRQPSSRVAPPPKTTAPKDAGCIVA